MPIEFEVRKSQVTRLKQKHVAGWDPKLFKIGDPREGQPGTISQGMQKHKTNEAVPEDTSKQNKTKA